MDYTDESAFESHVSSILIERSGWRPAGEAAWDVERALFPGEVVAFLRETQPGPGGTPCGCPAEEMSGATTEAGAPENRIGARWELS